MGSNADLSSQKPFFPLGGYGKQKECYVEVLSRDSWGRGESLDSRQEQVAKT